MEIVPKPIKELSGTQLLKIRELRTNDGFALLKSLIDKKNDELKEESINMEFSDTVPADYFARGKRKGEFYMGLFVSEIMFDLVDAEIKGREDKAKKEKKEREALQN